MKEICEVSDKEILRNLKALNSDEVQIVAKTLLYLIEVGKRRLYASSGYSSLFAYCVGALNYCDGTAGRRIVAARCIEKFPTLLNLFLEQKITLTSIVLVSKIINEKNKAEVIQVICNKSKSEVENYVAGFLPEKSIREGIRAIPSQPKMDAPSTNLLLFPGNLANSAMEIADVPKSADSGASITLETQTSAPPPEKSSFAKSVHDSERNFEVKIKAPGTVIKKLHKVQELRGKKESLGELFELLLDQYIERYAPEARIKRREMRTRVKQAIGANAEGALPMKQRSDNGAPRNTNLQSRYIEPKIRDEVYLRDGGCCAFITRDGKRCNSRKYLQIDHVQPLGKGGSDEIENLRLLCSAHNRFVAEYSYGRERMDKYVRKRMRA